MASDRVRMMTEAADQQNKLIESHVLRGGKSLSMTLEACFHGNDVCTCTHRTYGQYRATPEGIFRSQQPVLHANR